MEIVYVTGESEELFEIPEWETYFSAHPKKASYLEISPHDFNPLETVKITEIKIETIKHPGMRKQIKLATNDTLSEDRIEKLIQRYGTYYSSPNY